METGMVILVIALVIVALAGPVAGYFYAASRQRRKGTEVQRQLRDLEDEVRRARSTPPPARPIGGAQHVPVFPPLPPPPTGLVHNTPGIPARTGPLTSDANPQSAQWPSATGANRFAQEPPLFGDEKGHGTPRGIHGHTQAPRIHADQQADRVAPLQPSRTEPFQGAPPRGAVPATVPKPLAEHGRQNPQDHQDPGNPGGRPLPGQSQQPAQAAPTRQSSSMPSASAPREPDSEGGDGAAPIPTISGEFRPLSDMLDAASAEELAWLGNLTVGRRVRLKKLGYDAPAKMANLRRSEIRRLARELDVSELDIRDNWVPAARARLKRQSRG